MRPLPSPLYVVGDKDACERAGWQLVDFAAACLEGGARLLQIRAKAAPSAWLLEATMAIVDRARGRDALIVVNDRADIARLAGAGGVHVGQTDLSPAAARILVGPDAVVGLSTHTPDQYAAASDAPLNYVAIGPVFLTGTKETGCGAVGLDGVRRAAEWAASVDLPLVAIGGITVERARSVREAGAQSVAVIADLLATGDPNRRVREFLQALA